jgi:Family of unknown function (DUF6292)
MTDDAANVVAVNTQRADHAPYVAAVRRALEARDLVIQGMAATFTANGCRQAMLELRPEAGSPAELAPEPVIASWDEERGWSLRDQLGVVFREGIEVLPEPGAVAAWIVVALAYPALAATFPDCDRFRGHTAADAVFELRLAGYAPGG